MGWGSSMEGVVAESSCSPSTVCLPWVSERGIWDVPGILRGCPGPLGVFKKVVQKKSVCIFRSLYKKSAKQGEGVGNKSVLAFY